MTGFDLFSEENIKETIWLFEEETGTYLDEERLDVILKFLLWVKANAEAGELS